MSKNKKVKSIPPKGPLYWIYSVEQDRTMRDLYEILSLETEYSPEYWEEAAVLELSFSDGGNLDMEQSEDDGIYWVTVSSKGYEAAMDAMKEIEKLCGGQFSIDE